MRVRTDGLADHWPVAAFGALLIADIVLKRGFSPFDLRSLCVNSLPLALIALGQFFVILARGIDLSLGPIASVAGAIAALMLSNQPVLAIVLALGSGMVAGAINGALIAGLRLQPIIVTLATMSIWQGAALILLPDPGGDIPPELQEALAGGSGIVSAPLAIMVAAILAPSWVMSTPFGQYLRALGDDEQAARMSGVRTVRVKFAAYVIAGALAAGGGFYLTVATSSGSPTIGNDYILTSIAAVVVGGVGLTGGTGTPLGVVMGALVLTIMGSLLYFAGVSSFYQSVINGCLLLVIVAAGAGHARYSQSRGTAA